MVEKRPFLEEKPEELKKQPSRTDPIRKRTISMGGNKYTLRSYKPQAMKELCQTCTRLNICDHVLQPLPSQDGTQLCIEYDADPSTRLCRFCGTLNRLGVADVRCHKCGSLLVIPNPYLRIQKVKIDEEGNIRKIIKRNVTE